MRRLHLFELEDQPWVPAAIRDGATDLLDLLFTHLDIYGGVAPQLEAALTASGTDRAVDLCSGGGGGTLAVVRGLLTRGQSVSVTFTDRYPNAAAITRIARLGDTRLTYLPDPVDAMGAGGALPGVRTCAGALHHFRPHEVQAFLAALVARRQSLVVFDVAASPLMRRMPVAVVPFVMMANLPLLFAGALVMMPLVRPVRIGRLAWTYLLPAVPLLFAWDGTVSALRAYTPEELLELARAVPGGDGYQWRAATAGRALYLAGTPDVRTLR